MENLFSFQEKNRNNLRFRFENLQKEHDFTEKLSQFLFLFASKLDFDSNFEYIGYNHFIFHFGNDKIIYQNHYSEVIFTFFKDQEKFTFSTRNYERIILKLLQIISENFRFSFCERKKIEDLFSSFYFINLLDLTSQEISELYFDKERMETNKTTIKKILETSVKTYKI